MKELCSTLEITHLKTSPYHPQTDSCLEWWYSSLKTMLRKKENRQHEWYRLLKFCCLPIDRHLVQTQAIHLSKFEDY